MANKTDALEVLRGILEGKAGAVFGTPVVHKGLTVLPVARVSGGGGGGGGQDTDGRDGSGGGLGLVARPVGVFVISDDDVRWSPAIDRTRIILGGQLVAVAALLTFRTLIKVLRHRSDRSRMTK